MRRPTKTGHREIRYDKKISASHCSDLLPHADCPCLCCARDPYIDPRVRCGPTLAEPAQSAVHHRLQTSTSTGGIIVLADADNIAADFLQAMRDYSRDIATGDDETGSAAIMAGRCNDLAPGSGN